jgi:hypothetical protein
MTKQYATALAFRTALEERLKNYSRKSGFDLQKLRRHVVFDRLLCRLFQSQPGHLFLKGGYAMQLRMPKARMTKDIDLVLESKHLDKKETQEQEILHILQKASQHNPNDFFVFLIGESTLDLEAIPYGGSRFPVEAHLDGRLFERFPMDVVVSSLVLQPIEEVMSRDWLEFAGIRASAFPAISKEQQFAEKLHAYTLPRDDDENSRVKDMVDLLLLIHSGGLSPNLLMEAITTVFEYRGTHALPEKLKAPPANWESKFNNLAKECEIESSLTDAFQELCDYINDIRLKTID